MASDPIMTYGWMVLPRDPSIILNGKKNVKVPEPVKVDSIPLPDTELAKTVMKYAKKELREETFNHSMRVYYYDKNISATLMSFEFYGGLLALDLLHKTHHSPIEQAEAVAEAVIRHQDIGESGKITTLGQLIQLATIFDNMGGHADLVHKETIEDVVKHYPRKKWSSCFAATIRKENGLKPWAHTTALGEEDFPGGVENNKLMEPYD